MSKEQDFYKLIEEQPSKEKEKIWSNISKQLNNEEIIEMAVPHKKKFWTITKIASVCSSVIIVVVVAICASIGLFSAKDEGIRYCNQNDYYTIDSQYTLKEYSIINNNRILYFNWEDESEYYYNFEYRLYSSDEIVCFAEEIYDLSEVFITLYITDNRTEMDFLDFSNSCSYTTSVNNVKIAYGVGAMESRGYFTYQGYKYYLTIDFADSSYLISLCEQLLHK